MIFVYRYVRVLVSELEIKWEYFDKIILWFRGLYLLIICLFCFIVFVRFLIVVGFRLSR